MDILVSALISSTIEQLAKVIAENVRQKFRLLTGVEKEVLKIESNFKDIQCVLEDAEEKQIVEKSARRWIEKLKEVAYDMDDVLDEWNTAILKLERDKVESDCVKEVCSSFIRPRPRPRDYLQVFRGPDIATKIKKINEKLDGIAKDKVMYHFAKSSETKQLRPPETTSFVDVSKLHGREEVKNKIVSTLLGGDDIRTISIVGMGGIGKTALSQFIFHDEKVQAHFNNVIWVCVSDFFDQIKIAKAILEGLDPHSTNLQNSFSLEGVLNKISEKIKRAKFLLVLDDVWTEHDEDWESLKAVFQQGMSGSRILVTTRKESVATGMGSSQSQVFNLKELSDELCWLILSQVASVGRDNDLEDIGRGIAEKCKGLPLAAKTLGGLLRCKKTRDEWQNILNSEIWKDVAEKDIFKPLLLSYYDLPSEIRPCLLYCAIFPKDFVFWRSELIRHWMAHGYLGMEENNGEEYFNYLASRFFFQDFEKDADGNISQCKMHDIIHDFVQHLTKEEIVAVEDDICDNSRLGSSIKKAHHLRVTIAKKGEFPVFNDGIEKLRSFVTSGKMCTLTGKASQALFKGATCLRLLEFRMDLYGSGGVHVKEIPEEIEKLIHLRYLNFSGGLLEELPKGVCELHNLQYLNLYGCVDLKKLPEDTGKLINLRSLNLSRCYKLKRLPEGIRKLINLRSLNLSSCYDLKKLPEGIGKLINLRSLDIFECNNIEYYPKGISRLTSLRELTRVMARVDGNDAKGFNVGDLENLNLLRGFLHLIVVGNVDEEDAKRAKLHKKIHLNKLEIGFKEPIAVDPKHVIEALNPPDWLKIKRYDGTW